MHYIFNWRCNDAFKGILRMELRPNEIFARMSPIILTGPKNLYFKIKQISTLKMYLSYLVRAMRKRETRFNRIFDSDVIKMRKFIKPPCIQLMFPPKSEVCISLRGVVQLKRDITDAFVDLNLSTKVSK